jgi:hypothetical protein
VLEEATRGRAVSGVAVASPDHEQVRVLGAGYSNKGVRGFSTFESRGVLDPEIAKRSGPSPAELLFVSSKDGIRVDLQRGQFPDADP